MKSASPGSCSRYGPNTLRGKALALWRGCADLVWPPLCPVTGEPVTAPGELSPAAWREVRFLDAPWCARCGRPFDYPIGKGAVCGACAGQDNPPCRISRAAFVYDEKSRRLVLMLKHAGRTDGVSVFGRWMMRAGADALEGADALIPIPLHAHRLRKRRFNQSFLLARALSHSSGLPVEPHMLARSRPTPSQGGLSAKARRRNVAGAFMVREAAKPFVQGRRFVLVDDVHTTGATLQACARVLKRAGAEDVTAITLARVVKPVDPLK